MNERIKELAEPYLTYERFSRYGESTEEEYYDFLPEELEEFVLLIVRECCGAANDWYQNHSELHWDPAQHIRNHFGVKE
jgi:hypothetical protein